MPVTRSIGRSRSRAQEAQDLTAADNLPSASEAIVADNPSPSASATPMITAAAAAITVAPATPPKEQTTTEAPPSSPVPPSIRSKSQKSQRALRLAKAKEELLRLQVELAAARIATMEEESSDSDDSSVILRQTTRKVGIWLNDSQPHLTAAAAATEHDTTLQQPGTATCAPIPGARTTTVSVLAPNSADSGAALPPPSSATCAVTPDACAIATTATASLAPNCITRAASLPLPPTPPIVPISDNNDDVKPTPRTDMQELAAAIALAARSNRFVMDLPFFDGSYQQWLSFRAAYYEASSSLSEAENIGRLRRSLRGKAREAVSSLLIYGAAKTEVIMKTLEARFGRPDTIALAELESLRTLPRLTDTPKDICIYANRVSNIVATLSALKRLHYLYNPEAVKTTIEKLTPAMRYRWYDYAAEQSQEEADLLKLSKFLEREADRCGAYAQPENMNETRRVQKTYSTINNKSVTIIKKCRVCSDGAHKITECSKFTDASVNDRWDFAKTQRLCFSCLRLRTKSHRCFKRKCGVNGCPYTHHKLLHNDVYSEPTGEIDNDTKSTAGRSETVASTRVAIGIQAYLKIIPVRISGPAGVVNTHALLDDGSTVSIIDSELAKQAGITGPLDPFYIKAIGDNKVTLSNSCRVTFSIQGSSLRDYKMHARTMDNMQLSPQAITEEDIAGCSHLEDITSLLKYEAVEPRLLIGQDNWHLLTVTEVRQGDMHQPVASLTSLGWVLHGAHMRTLGQRSQHINFIDTSRQDASMDEQLKDYFALESLLITPKRPLNDPEERALNKLKSEVRVNKAGQYEVPLLWKQEDITMPSNYDSTLRRLHSIEKKLDHDPVLKHKYTEQMDALISNGYAERVTEASEGTSNRVWYLPHFAVLNPMKPGKVRIVHDAAAKTKGVSLNDCLLTGPDLLQSLPGVLMRFRQYKVAVTGDIKEMFLRLKVKHEDRDALRYLWRGEKRDDRPPEVYRMTSLIFGATCSPSIAIFVKNENARRYENTQPKAYRAIIKNHYVDDYICSFKTVEEAIKTSQEISKIHKEADYELRQWTSNSQHAMDALDTKATRTRPSPSVINFEKSERVLGLIWRPNTDEISFNLDLSRLPPGILEKKTPTKRETLKILMSLYDPLGLASPVTTRAKQILQEIWRRGIEWDQEINEDLAQQWAIWVHHLKNLRNISVPRCYHRYSDAATIQLHVFVDASEVSYAAVLYWRVTTPDGGIHVTMITAKSKVAPLKLMSIPRLELQAAVLGTRMATAIIEEHDRKPDCKIFWTDSRTVLTWVRTGARSYRPFVAHRIAAIEEHSTTTEWRWVPTRLNVADDATRDVPSEFTSKHRWYQGPQFLREDSSTWPSDKIELVITGEEKSASTCNTLNINITNILKSAIPDYSNFNKYEKLLRSTARVLQFLHLCRTAKKHKQTVNAYKRTTKIKENDPDWKRQSALNEIKQKKNNSTLSWKKFIPIASQHLLQAENLIIKLLQEEKFHTEINNLKNNEAISRNSRLRAISVEMLSGVLVVKSRISAACGLTDQQKRPPILDGDHYISRLYVDYIHRKLLHAGVEQTINECRQRFWILRLRPITRLIVHRCLRCRIKKATPPEPPTGDLPYCRLAHHSRPFTYAGVDYFGPLTVTVGRSVQKRYVALFTCLTTRAVHLEMAASLSTESAVMALRRMIARRGCPTEIWSDNGTNLRGADKELRRSIDHATQDEASKQVISWRFIPPGAPFMGGAWERLVRSVKTALTAVLHERHPVEEVLVTLLAEVEFTVNSRPLTHVSVDPDDPEALTPNHFVLHGPAANPTPGTFDDKDLIRRTHWRASQRLADLYWKRWLQEYLPELQRRRQPNGKGPTLKVGDVVLIVDNTMPRNMWPMGVVTATYPGKDGVVRVVDVRTKGGTLRRPVKKLVIMPTEPEQIALQ